MAKFYSETSQTAWIEAQAEAAEMIEAGDDIDRANAFLARRARTILEVDDAIIARRSRVAGGGILFIHQCLVELPA